MLMTTYQKEAKLKTGKLDIYLNDSKVANTSTEKLLGVTIDKNLIWKSNINNVATKYCFKNYLWKIKV